MLAVRREAVTWRRAWLANTPSAYWTYLQRYPRGPHAYDARLRLGSINAALTAPPRFEAYEFDVPPPVEEEEVYFRRPYVVFDDPDWGAPPPMGYLLPPRPISGRAGAAAAALCRPAALAADRRAAAVRAARRAPRLVSCARRGADPAARRQYLL